MIQRWKSYDKSYIMPNNHEGDFVKYGDHAAAMAEKDAAIAELVEALEQVRVLQEAIMNDRQSDLEFQHEQRCLARHAETLLKVQAKALIAKYKEHQ